MPENALKNTLIGRRELLRWVAATGAIAGCRRRSPASADGGLGAAVVDASAAAHAVELWSWFDLPDDPRSRELSGIAWDDEAHVLWAVQDETRDIVSLSPDADFRSWRFGPTVHTKIEGPLDLEGIVVLPDGFIVCSEIGPRIVEVDRAGVVRRELHLAARFGEALTNKSLESLSLSPDQRWLFTANEAALPRDGSRASVTAGTRIRIVRIDRQTGAMTEHAYATDPCSHEAEDYGVADVAAISKDELYVLERGWAKGSGNTVRIYRVSLGDERAERAACSDVDRLGTTPSLAKSLVVDLARVPNRGFPPAKQPQESALLDNFEGLAIGPRLPDGRRSLLLVSDDNAHKTQVARVLVLALD